MPNFGNFLSRKMATYFGMPNFGKKNGNLFFGMPNFGNLNLARKMATYFGIPNFGNHSPSTVVVLKSEDDTKLGTTMYVIFAPSPIVWK